MRNDWNQLLKDSLRTPPVPGLEHAPRRKKNTTGMIEPTTKKSHKRTLEYLDAMNKNIAHNAAISKNIATHRSNRQHHAKQVLAGVMQNHAVETGLRRARHVKSDRSNLIDMLCFSGALVFVFLCIWLVPFIAGAK